MYLIATPDSGLCGWKFEVQLWREGSWEHYNCFQDFSTEFLACSDDTNNNVSVSLPYLLPYFPAMFNQVHS